MPVIIIIKREIVVNEEFQNHGFFVRPTYRKMITFLTLKTHFHLLYYIHGVRINILLY